MGLGSLKILLSKEIPHYEVLDLFAFICYSVKPCICRLLWGLCRASHCDDLFFPYHASIVDYCLSSLALVFIPSMLGAIVTEVSLLMTGVTLNFADIPSRTIRSSPSSLEESSMWIVSPLRYVASTHRSWVYFFTSCNSSSCSSSRGIHGIWICKLVSWCPSPLLRFQGTSSSMCL